MSATTGNLYLLVYDKPTGLTNFSGFIFSRPIRVPSIGDYNYTTGFSRSLLIGNYNTAQSIINSGSYSTIIGTFNNIYNLSGGYAYRNNVIGSENNLINSIYTQVIGRNNNFDSGTDLNLLGNQNTISNVIKNTVIGNENNITDSEETFVFGSDNAVSGTKTFVIGHQNTIDTGDYNSIFIGFGYESNGENKNTSVNINCFDSSIQVSPSEIKLNSSEKPTINGQTILIEEDLKELDLQNIGSKTYTGGFLIKDSGYNDVCPRIFINNLILKSGANTKQYNGSVNISPYTGISGLQNNLSIYNVGYTFSGYNLVYGSPKNYTGSPFWMITDQSGIYYTNKNYSINQTPQTGWIATGFYKNGIYCSGDPTSSFNIDLFLGTRSGLVSMKVNGNSIYLPYFY